MKQMELKLGMTVREAGREVYEKGVQETALAYVHANPDTQYNTATSLTKVLWDATHHPKGPLFMTGSFPPEFASSDVNYYGVCRSFAADVIFNATGFEVPGLNAGQFHNDMKNYAECLLFRFGHKYADFDMPNAYKTDDKAAFMETIKREMRPGDIILADPEGKTGHVIMFIGDALGDGKDYIVHCWPLGGGTWRWETPVNKREPNGAIVLQSAEEFLYTVGSKPNWCLATERMADIFILRFSSHPGLLDSTFTPAAVTRYNKQGLIVKKHCSATIYDTVLPGETVTVTETFTNTGKRAYSLDVTEHVPAGVKLTGAPGAEVKDAHTLFWRIEVPAGKSAAVSFTMTVTAKPGTMIAIPSGTCDTLPTRPVRFKVGASRFTPAQIKKIAGIGKRIPGGLKTNGFEDLAYVKRFYREVLGKEIALPDTVDGLIRSVAKPCRVDKRYPRVLIPKERYGLEGKAVCAMSVPRMTQGKYYMVPGDQENNLERSMDFLEEFFQPGDVMVTTGGKNKLKALDPDGIALFIYLGDSKVLSYRKSGSAIEAFEESFPKAQLNNFDLVLRPAYLY